MENAQPNKGHLSVARLVEEGRCLAVITQNVDNLHQDAGVPREQVIELHGNASYATCLSCGIRYELGDLERQFKQLGRVEPCGRCGRHHQVGHHILRPGDAGAGHAARPDGG